MFIVAGLFSTCALAQTRDLSAINGQVLDPQGKVIPGAAVTLTNPAINLDRSTKTDSSGYYSFGGLPITANYSVQVKATGFSDAQEQNILLRAGQSAVVNLTLGVSGQQTQITVYGTPGNVNVDTDQVTSRFDVQKIEETPILNRKITAVPLLDSAARQAQTTGDIFMNEVLFVMNGTGRRQTDYVLDNTDDNDRWGRQTMFAAVPMSVVQELNVDKNTISTEYGRNAGYGSLAGEPLGIERLAWRFGCDGTADGRAGQHAAHHAPGLQHTDSGQRYGLGPNR